MEIQPFKQCLISLVLFGCGFYSGYYVTYIVYFLYCCKRQTKSKPPITIKITDEDNNEATACSSKVSLFSDSCHSVPVTLSFLSVWSSDSFHSACESLHSDVPSKASNSSESLWDHFRAEASVSREVGYVNSEEDTESVESDDDDRKYMDDPQFILKGLINRRFYTDCGDVFIDYDMMDLKRSEIVKELNACVLSLNRRTSNYLLRQIYPNQKKWNERFYLT